MVKCVSCARLTHYFVRLNQPLLEYKGVPLIVLQQECSVLHITYRKSFGSLRPLGSRNVLRMRGKKTRVSCTFLFSSLIFAPLTHIHTHAYSKKQRGYHWCLIHCPAPSKTECVQLKYNIESAKHNHKTRSSKTIFFSVIVMLAEKLPGLKTIGSCENSKLELNLEIKPSKEKIVNKLTEILSKLSIPSILLS